MSYDAVLATYIGSSLGSLLALVFCDWEPVFSTWIGATWMFLALTFGYFMGWAA